MSDWPTSIWTPPTRGTNMSDAVTQTDILDEQNDEIVALQTSLGAGFAGCTNWTSYTPTLGVWTLGSGTQAGAWIKVNGIIWFYFTITFGAGMAGTAGSPTVALPANCHSGMQSMDTVSIALSDTGTSTHEGVGRLGSSTLTVLRSRPDTNILQSQAISSSLPFTWVSTDIIRGAGWYRAA